MLTKYERDLINYWKNWKPGMRGCGKKPEDYVEEVKPIDVHVEVDLDGLAGDIGERIWDII